MRGGIRFAKWLPFSVSLSPDRCARRKASKAPRRCFSPYYFAGLALGPDALSGSETASAHQADRQRKPVQHQSTDEVLRPGRWGCYSGVDGQRGNIRAHSREYRLRYHSGVDGQREATGGWARRCERFTSGKPTFAVERDPVGNTRNRRKSVRYSAGSKSARRCRGASRYQSRRKLTHHSAGVNSTTSDCCFRS
jgi:hypothetical protein